MGYVTCTQSVICTPTRFRSTRKQWLTKLVVKLLLLSQLPNVMITTNSLTTDGQQSRLEDMRRNATRLEMFTSPLTGKGTGGTAFRARRAPDWPSRAKLATGC